MYINISEFDYKIIKNISKKLHIQHYDFIGGFTIFYLEYKHIIKKQFKNDIHVAFKLVDLWNDLPINSKYVYIDLFNNEYNYFNVQSI